MGPWWRTVGLILHGRFLSSTHATSTHQDWPLKWRLSNFGQQNLLKITRKHLHILISKRSHTLHLLHLYLLSKSILVSLNTSISPAKRHGHKEKKGSYKSSNRGGVEYSKRCAAWTVLWIDPPKIDGAHGNWTQVHRVVGQTFKNLSSTNWLIKAQQKSVREKAKGMGI